MEQKKLIGIGIITVLIVLFFGVKVFTPGVHMKPVIRQPAVAGTWYPATKGALREAVEGYLSSTAKPLQGLKALIVPHAGFRFSGPVAGAGFSVVPKGFSKVIVIGLSHHYPFRGASVFNGTHYKTPLGLVQVSKDAKTLLKEPGMGYVPQAHSEEHSIEIELPFLQVVLPGFLLLPVLTSNTDPAWLASELNRFIDNSTLVVVSSDLSHYKPYEVANGIDNTTISAILTLNLSKMERQGDACNKRGILTLIHLAKAHGWRPVLIEYKNSGDTYGDKSRVVGYAAIAFVEQESLGLMEQEFLLNLSRKTLESIYNKSISVEVAKSELTPALKAKKGCFVTLTERGALRGCIGHILPQEPVWKCVIDNTKNAALNDPRFSRVAESELRDIEIEVSVLTVPKPLEYTSPEELLDRLEPGQDGVVIQYGLHSATYLPQVWEQLPNQKEFLSRLCLKASAPSDCWKKGARVLTYRALVFREGQQGE